MPFPISLDILQILHLRKVIPADVYKLLLSTEHNNDPVGYFKLIMNENHEFSGYLLFDYVEQISQSGKPSSSYPMRMFV